LSRTIIDGSFVIGKEGQNLPYPPGSHSVESYWGIFVSTKQQKGKKKCPKTSLRKKSNGLPAW